MASASNGELAAIDPQTYLALARELAQRNDPAALRSAGDRAYHAAFLYSRNELFRKGYVVSLSTISSHGSVSAALARHVGTSAVERRRVQEAGDKLRKAREALTYETDAEATTRRLERDYLPTENTLPWMLTAASQIIASVGALPILR